MAGTVVMNRVAHTAFKGNSIAEVVYAAGQYEPTWSGSIVNTPSETAYRVARWLLAGNRAFGPDVVWQGPKQGYNCVYIGHMWFGTYTKGSHDLDEFWTVENTEPAKSTEIAEPTEITKVEEVEEPTEITKVEEVEKLEEPTEIAKVEEPEEPMETAKVEEPTELAETEETTETGEITKPEEPTAEPEE